MHASKTDDLTLNLARKQYLLCVVRLRRLQVYTKPEREMLEGSTDSSSLHSVATFLLECNRARKYLEPFPLNELPWGPTQAFYDFKMKIHNQMGPIISRYVQMSEAASVVRRRAPFHGAPIRRSRRKKTVTVSRCVVACAHASHASLSRPRAAGAANAS